MLAGFAGNLRSLPEIPRLRLDRVDMRIGNVEVARVQAIWRQTARIEARTAVVKLVAAAVRQRERDVSVCRRGLKRPRLISLRDAANFATEAWRELRKIRI